MYSPRITQRHIEQVESTSGLTLYHHTPSDSRAVHFERLAPLMNAEGKLTRNLTTEEHAFIRNERILSQLDFLHFLRWATQISDKGGLFYLDSLWESQKLLLAKLAYLEERNADQAAQGSPCDGMLIADHKGGRQLGHTAISRTLIWHRTLFYPHTRTASVSVDDPGITGVFSKDELLLDHLPWWLRPTLRYKSKDSHFKFEPLGSSVTYYQAQQRSGVGTGIGTGQTFDATHMTEVSMYAYPEMLEKDFFPTIPQNAYSLCLLETTAFYRGGWWFEFSEAVRMGRKPRWSYLFIPFYAEPSKYRRAAPDSWQPSPHTIAMAKTVERTSPEFMGGQTIHLHRDQLYWWETSYAEAQETNTLNSWLGNYACVAGSTHVSTDTGIQPIEAAFEASSVETGKIERWHSNGVRPVYTLETEWGRRLTATADHRVFLSDGSDVPLMELVKGQEIQLAPPKFAEQYYTLQWSPIACQTNSVKIDEDMGRFLGYYMGDGSYSDDTISIACTAKDEDVVADVTRLFKIIVGKQPTYQLHQDGGCMYVKCWSKHWKPLLWALSAIRHWDQNKSGLTRKVCVPKAIFSSPRSVVAQFLSGLFEADAHAYPYWARTSFCAAYRDFTEDVQLLLLGFGLNSKLTVTSSRASTKSTRYFTAHLLALGAAASDIFHRDIGFVSKRKRSACVGVAGNPAGKPDGRRRPNRLVDHVKSIEPASEMPVFDLTVVDSHRYGANGILVHNCTPEQSFQHAGQSAFPLKLLDALRMQADPGWPFEVEVA